MVSDNAFPGGWLIVGGANSPSAGVPLKYSDFDEIDLWEKIFPDRGDA
jgi:hypothetical protein